MSVTTAVWVLFFISTGVYNGGTVTSYEHEFTSKDQCEYVLKQFYDKPDAAWGRTSSLCVEVPVAERSK